VDLWCVKRQTSIDIRAYKSSKPSALGDTSKTLVTVAETCLHAVYQETTTRLQNDKMDDFNTVAIQDL